LEITGATRQGIELPEYASDQALLVVVTCTGPGISVSRCPFGVVEQDADGRPVAFDPANCFG